jgi:ceramide glucosyltransferase
MIILVVALAAVSLSGAVFLLAAALAVWRFTGRPIEAAGIDIPVTILKPLHGEDAQLYENLRSFCEQRHTAYQIVFGVRDMDDRAIPVVERLIAEFPDKDLALVVDPTIVGNNFKVSNLENMMALAKNDVFVIADSDMHVAPDYLGAVTAPLADPAVGLVTCLYRGRPVEGVWSRLGAMFVNNAFLPSAVIGEAMRPGNACFGATMALRRDTYDAIGGFASLRDQLADDYALGAAVRRIGRKIVLSRYLVDTVIAEPDLGALFRHELRWARTIRLLAPFLFAGSVLTHPVALALAAALLDGLSLPTLAILALVLACRLATVRLVDRALALPLTSLWLVPLRDLLSFGVFVASFLGNQVAWRNRTFRIAADGRLVTDGDSRA